MLLRGPLSGLELIFPQWKRGGINRCRESFGSVVFAVANERRTLTTIARQGEDRQGAICHGHLKSCRRKNGGTNERTRGICARGFPARPFLVAKGREGAKRADSWTESRALSGCLFNSK